MTLEELADRYARKQITNPLMLDNDTVSVYQGDDDEPVFESDPETVLNEALTLLGIPHEYV